MQIKKTARTEVQGDQKGRKIMEEKREEVKQPWECMAQAFAQINSLFLPVKKEEKEESEVKHE